MHVKGANVLLQYRWGQAPNVGNSADGDYLPFFDDWGHLGGGWYVRYHGTGWRDYGDWVCASEVFLSLVSGDNIVTVCGCHWGSYATVHVHI